MFCHLHIHNEFSVLDGYGTAKQFVKRASQMGFKYLALTNHGNIDGLLQWQEACLEYDIKPVLQQKWLDISTGVHAWREVVTIKNED